MRFQKNQAELETTNRLRRNVANGVRLPASLSVEAAVSAVMCTLTERLTAGEAHDVLRAVPKPIAPMFELCVRHRAGKPTEKMDRAAFVERVADHLDVTPAHAEIVCSAVFTAVRAELPPEVVDDVAAQLPHGLKDLWLGPPISAPDLDVDVRPEDARLAIEADVDRRAYLPLHVTPAAAIDEVMCTFSRRLSGGETRHLLLGLPPPLRALLVRCTVHRNEHAAVFGREDLLRHIGEHLRTDRSDTVRITREVLRAIKRTLPQRTIVEVASQLPADLLELWEAR